MAFLPVTSVVVFQSDPAQLHASVTGTVSVRNMPSVYGNISGSVAAVQIGTWSTSVMTNVITSIATAGQVMGSVATLQGTNPWVVVGSIYGNISGSVVAFPIGNQSVSGTIGASVIGTVPITQSGTMITSVSGAITGSVQAAVSGSVVSFQGGTWAMGVMTNVITSIATAGQVMGSIATLQGTNPWVVNFQNSSILVIPVGSVITLPTSATASVYAVLSSITSVSILSANTARKGAAIYNNAGTPMFIELGTPVTTSVFTVRMADQSYYEVPYGWTGVVAGISASNAGVVTVTELT